MTRQFAAATNDGRQARVIDTNLLAAAALAAEVEAQPVTLGLDVMRAQCGQAIGTVAARVLLVTDAYQGAVEQTHHSGKHLFARQSWQPQIACDAAAQRRQHLAERSDAREFLRVTPMAPTCVIAVLL